ncbi:NAD-dependent epimerase/dehydratase family protein [Adhaeribacter radiodurans]|uniref:NAD-dependent epimerase/dehydratase family protein n=1 Tax=Adhaeribacter radiodurans TaxID=2745197 RepID=A0A7L7LE99_9BACT|nr:NAD-dependent epimerase/dehydratase family protein [Adhaeribacter radiodurans]QMU30739.1 NAD-dependent epimerase/dehydratase family protein [Adhaeribacter radiodurans]
MIPTKEKILVIGACGQLGSELTLELRKIYGDAQVVAADISLPRQNELVESGPFEILDVLDRHHLADLAYKHEFTQIYHLAAVLSATGEKRPKFTWKVNMKGLENILDLTLEKGIAKVYWPSSIAVFGPNTPRHHTPQHTITDPNTVYGISKLTGERFCEYYATRYKLDIRSLRYPGLISYKALPGGGTTDYAVDIYYKAVEEVPFECYLAEHTYLPMMYMPDALKATLELMHAPAENIKIRSSYNLTAMSFSPAEIATSIQEHIPDFKIMYKPDYRQQIAASWPESIDDSAAQKDWNWQPDYDLPRMTQDMLTNLRKQKAGL